MHKSSASVLLLLPRLCHLIPSPLSHFIHFSLLLLLYLRNSVCNFFHLLYIFFFVWLNIWKKIVEAQESSPMCKHEIYLIGISCRFLQWIFNIYKSIILSQHFRATYLWMLISMSIYTQTYLKTPSLIFKCFLMKRNCYGNEFSISSYSFHKYTHSISMQFFFFILQANTKNAKMEKPRKRIFIISSLSSPFL